MNNNKNKKLPVYSLNSFREESQRSLTYQVEDFDANRHFQVDYPHRHDFYEVLYLLKGSGYHIIDNNTYKIEPPCMFFLSPGQAHELELSHDIEGYIFLFAPEFYLLNHKNKNRLLEFPFFFSVQQINPPLNFSQADDAGFIRNLFIRAIGCSKKNRGGATEQIRAILDLILITCSDLYPMDSELIKPTKGHITVKRFLHLIEENYQNNLRINDYADKLAITSNHLTQLVKQVTGKTSVELIQEKVVVETKRLLLHTNLTVSEIASMFNFPDQSYFSKYFKKNTGCTPLDYRKNP